MKPFAEVHRSFLSCRVAAKPLRKRLCTSKTASEKLEIENIELRMRNNDAQRALKLKRQTVQPSKFRTGCEVVTAIFPTVNIANHYLLGSWQPAYMNILDLLASNGFALKVLPAQLPPEPIAFAHTSLCVAIMVTVSMPLSKKLLNTVMPEASTSLELARNYVVFGAISSGMMGIVHYFHLLSRLAS
jgi:hypothetical protein